MLTDYAPTPGEDCQASDTELSVHVSDPQPKISAANDLTEMQH